MEIRLSKANTQLVVSQVAPAAVWLGRFIGRPWVASHFELIGIEELSVVGDQLLDSAHSTFGVTVLAFMMHTAATMSNGVLFNMTRHTYTHVAHADTLVNSITPSIKKITSITSDQANT